MVIPCIPLLNSSPFSFPFCSPLIPCLNIWALALFLAASYFFLKVTSHLLVGPLGSCQLRLLGRLILLLVCFCGNLVFPLSFIKTSCFLLGLSSLIFQPISLIPPNWHWHPLWPPLESVLSVYLRLFGHHLLEAPGPR